MSKIRKSAQGEECSLRLDCCNYNTDTTVFAHISIKGNSGIGTKPIDLHGVYACSDCHDAIDGRVKGVQFSDSDKLRAMIETQGKLVKKGLVTFETF